MRLPDHRPVAGPPPTDADLTAARFRRWQEQVDTTLASVIPPGPVALVNFPKHRNAGDAAIWLAERAALDRIGRPVVYRCTWNGFSRSALRRRLGDGTILINGGGNLGDVYRGQQGLREHTHPVSTAPEALAVARQLLNENGQDTAV